MGLTSDLISEFVKITNDNNTDTKKETTVYGTTVEHNDTIFVKIDGSDLLTPVKSTVNMKPDERVTVMIKNHTATVTGNLSSPAARNEDVKDAINAASKISEFEIIIADKADISELAVEKARIDNIVIENANITRSLEANEAVISELSADNVTINERLTAAEADISDLKVDKLDVDVANITFATIEKLNATDADIHNLEATFGNFEVLSTNKFTAIDATIEELDAKHATVVELEAEQARITDLEAEVGSIDTLIFGSATGDTIQTSFSNAVIAQLGDAQIKSAMIENVTASKITSGDIITNNIRVKSEDGSLLISDETIQISDDNRVRVQIGKDASGDYSINIWDNDGNLMFSKGGITDSAIKDAIIRNDMVSDTANIAAHKLDIDSLFEEINGSSNTIKSTQVYLDDEGQSLAVAFKAITEGVGELENTVTSQGTQITAVQGQIASKVWQQDINTAKNELSETTETLSTQYSALEQNLDSVSATVASHTSTLANKADNSSVKTVSDNVTSVQSDLSGFKTTVSNTYATKTALESTDTKATNAASAAAEAQNGVDDLEERVSTAETAIEQNASDISLRATKSELFTAKSEAISAASTDATTKANNAVTSANNNTANLLKNYSTTSQMNSAIELKANSITSSVSSTYATKSELSNLEIGGRNLWENSNFVEPLPVNSITTNGNVEIVDLESGNPTGFSKAVHVYNGNGRVICSRFVNESEELIGRTISLSCWIKYSDVAKGDNDWNALNIGKFALVYTLADGTKTAPNYGVFIAASITGSSDGWQHLTASRTFRDDVEAVSLGGVWVGLESASAGDMWVTGIKMEFGKATDWSPAPEDLATEADLASVENRMTSAETKITQNTNSITSVASRTTSAENRISSAESKITQNTNSISSVVSRTSANESAISTLEQTADGLTVRIGDAESDIATAQSTANTAKTNAATAQSTADAAKTAASNAQSTANTAKTNAATAQSTADAAKKQLYHSASGTSGTTGYVGFCTIKVTGSYANRPILFELRNRGKQSTNVSLCFSNVNSNDPTLSHIQRDGGINVWAYKSATSTWILIAEKSEGYDTIYVNDFSNDGNNVAISWSNIHYSSLPTSNITSATLLAGKIEKSVVDNAAKTATNYLNFSSSGLVIGDHTSDTLKKNVLIDSDSVDIRNGNTVLASFGADTIILGQNAENSVINLCDGAGTIKTAVSETATSYPAYDSILIESQELNMAGRRIDLNTSYADSDEDNTSHMLLLSDTSSLGSEHTIVASGVTNKTGMTSAATDNYVNTYTKIYATGWNETSGAYIHNSISVYPLRTQFAREITINGNRITGANKVLWSGGYYMTSGHSCTLSEGVYDQTNGIVLLFSEYISGAASNTAFHSFFVPKEMVVLHTGAGYCFQMSSSNLAYYATKYLYISNTKITGHDNNTLTGSSTCGITRTCNRFILRYVIGV